MTFYNPYAAVLQAFKNIYGDVPVDIIWDTTIKKRFWFFGCWGFTYFENQCMPKIHLSPYLSVIHSTEILAHELAHVAAGVAAGHGTQWELAFDKIYAEWFTLVRQGV